MSGVAIRGGCVAVHDSRGPAGAAPIVLVHGVGGHAGQWPAELRALPGRRVIAVDLPGHGVSPAPPERSIGGHVRALVDLLDRLEVGPVIVAGHSMGGAIALTLALEAPERIAGLALVATGARLRVAPDILEGTADPALLPQTARTLAERSFGRDASAEMRAAYVREKEAAPAGLLHSGYVACDAFDVMERLGEIRAPTFVVCGEDDRATPPKYSEKLRAAIPSAELVLVPGAGHMIIVEKPAAVAQAIGRFVESLGR